MRRFRQPGSSANERGGIVLWLGGGLVLLGALIAGAVAGYWLFVNLIVNITLKDQPAAISLPEKIRATAEVTNVLDITMQGDITTSVPFEETLKVPFKGRYDFDVRMSPEVPVEFTVNYDGVIPVDTMASVTAETDIDYKTLKQIRNLEFSTKIPLDFNLPVNLEIPVKETINLKYEGPISATIDDELKTRVDTTLNATLPVDQTIQSPVTAAIPLEVYLPQKPVRAVLNHVAIGLKPTMLGLELAESDELDEPERLPSPFGSAATQKQQ